MQQARKAVTEANFSRRGFWSLMATQGQGAFNDNVYQYFVVFFLTAALVAVPEEGGWWHITWFGLDKRIAPIDYIPGLSTFLFAVPFVVFPSLFGSLADRFSKGRIIIATKYLEVVVMAFGGLALYTGNLLFIFAILFFMATQSAMFGPAKYGILPEMLPEERLSWGNGLLQMGTIVAIILGTVTAGQLYNVLAPSQSFYLASVFMVSLSVLGVLTSHFVTRPEAANPNQPIPMNPLMPWSGMGRYFKFIWQDRVMLNVVIGYVYFWTIGALVRNNVLKLTKSDLGFAEGTTSAYLGIVALGIGIGAVAAGYMSRKKIELGLIPICALGMAFFALLLSIPPLVYAPLLTPLALLFGEGAGALGFKILLGINVFGLGFFAGGFDVPLAASIQQRAPQGMKGGIIATTNLLTWFGMGLSGLLFTAFGAVGFLTTYHVFLITALSALAMGIYISWRLPHLYLRSLIWCLETLFYRVHTKGREHIPDTGGALLVANHMSLIDTLAIMASTDRVIHFVACESVFQKGITGRLARFMRIIAVKSTAGPGDLEAVEREIRQRIATGDVVCINCEPRYSANSAVAPWHKSFERIMHDLDAPIIPLHHSRLWEHVYVFKNNRFHWRRRCLQRLPLKRYPIHVHIGPPAAEGATAELVRAQVTALGLEQYTERRNHVQQLHHGFIRMARRNLRKRAIADAVSGELSYFKTLVGSLVFARTLKQVLDQREKVGVLLPPSVGGVLTNAALQIMGRVPVNLNYTATAATMASCAKQCDITQVITSKKFLERLPLDVPGQAIYLEDVREMVKGSDRIWGMLMALFAPVRVIERALGRTRRSPDDLATIIFSSGSEGEPKGVMLTQRNVMCNIEQTLEFFPHDGKTCLVGFLPFFHSFGYTVTLWMTLMGGLSAVYHANPLEPKIIGRLIEQYRGTIMIGTSTFLQGFIRRCMPEQLSSLVFVVCGAEKLAPRVRTAFKEKFGLEPLEGYGTTECAPVVSANIPDCISPGFYWQTTKHGSIGRTLPGIALRVLDPDTRETRALGESGLLLVKGPNIMKGYLNQPEKTAAVLQDGWYETGDIAALDEYAFITITDRLARFSKIAGEMVPHTKVEEVLHGLLGLTDQMMAVTSVPDVQKGERLVVLHTLDDAQLEELQQKVDTSGLPNLWIPRTNSFYRIEEIPVLGTGKMDIRGVKKLAEALDLGA
ncbi:MAG: MFS transporter [Candidatus Hydrogenedentes bacterium]|nr:MFS transporter [Candidatus Hydrogenedentota bacterium]